MATVPRDLHGHHYCPKCGRVFPSLRATAGHMGGCEGLDGLMRKMDLDELTLPQENVATQAAAATEQRPALQVVAELPSDLRRQPVTPNRRPDVAQVLTRIQTVQAEHTREIRNHLQHIQDGRNQTTVERRSIWGYVLVGGLCLLSGAVIGWTLRSALARGGVEGKLAEGVLSGTGDVLRVLGKSGARRLMPQGPRPRRVRHRTKKQIPTGRARLRVVK